MILLIKALHPRSLRIKCSINDHFSSSMPVSVAFFYSKQIPKETIIQALEHVLDDFPLFAGVIQEEQGQLYIHCNNQGVALTIVHLDKLFDLQRHDPSTFVELIDPKKALRQQTPLLTIKLSYYQEGMAIGYCWHHSLGDMATFMEFVKALSAFAKGQSYNPPLIAEDRNQYSQNTSLPMGNKASLKRLNWIDILRFFRHVISPKKAFYLYFTQNEIESLRAATSEKVGYKLSRNDVLCAHVLTLLAKCRHDTANKHYASVIVNSRSRMGFPPNTLGNYLGAITVAFTKPPTIDFLANNIHQAVKQFLPDHPSAALNFIEKNGGIRNVKKIIPHEFLPEYKNLIISNWSNFGVYTIDFGTAFPTLFLPVGKAPLPWLSCIVEGFHNQGLLVSLVLPKKLAKRFTTPMMLQQLHQYRPISEETPQKHLLYF